MSLYNLEAINRGFMCGWEMGGVGDQRRGAISIPKNRGAPAGDSGGGDRRSLGARWENRRAAARCPHRHRELVDIW